ncbi:MAG: HAMP domain-containing protein [Treponema sp.]|nr:HAMP domain-containing protein [Treponema sp.]
MKNGKTRPEYSIINVRVLILIYVLLCVLTILFSRIFFIDTLRDGNVPDKLSLLVFFTTPAVLFIFLGISVFNLVTDIIARRPGSKFMARLMAYFTVIVILTAAPVTVMTGAAINELVRFWHNIDTDSATNAANAFVVENYAFHERRFDSIIKQNDFSRPAANLPEYIAAVQIFNNTDGKWDEDSFTGEAQFRLQEPPSMVNGMIKRNPPDDAATIRYVQPLSQNKYAVISYNLGEEFDWGRDALENQAARFKIIHSVRKNLKPLLIFYYGVFFFPTLLMTVIIAISFIRRVTRPIVELTEATRHVAEGNFSIQILTRRNDELGLLIRSFNAMVQDLEKSRAALVKSEKISIWQNMAQQLAHEIKNPLTPIKLSAERILRRWRNEPERIGEILESSIMAIIQETEGLSTLLNEFRTLSKPMEPSQSWTNLKETVHEAIIPYFSSYPNVQFNIEHIDSSILLKIDKHRLSQILTNLIINAIDAMNSSGSIEIRTDLVKKREISYSRLSVKDSGKGISEQDGQLIFTPYFTTKGSGTGLGLPIVERIINDHGGAIWFNSAEGMGTTFFIDLPAEKTVEGN